MKYSADSKNNHCVTDAVFDSEIFGNSDIDLQLNLFTMDVSFETSLKSKCTKHELSVTILALFWFCLLQ